MCVPLPSIQGAELGSRSQAGEEDLQSHQPCNARGPQVQLSLDGLHGHGTWG